MRAGRFSWIGAASGAGFVLLLIAGGGGDSTVAVALELVGLVLIIPFLSYLWRVLGDAEGPGGWLATCAFGAGLADVTIKLASIGPGKVAERFGETTEMHQALQDINSVAFIVTMLPLSVMMGAVAAVTLRHGGLPRWLGWFAAMTSATLLVNGMFLDSVDAPAFLLFMVWVLLASGWLTLRGNQTRTVTDPLAAAAGH